ncbi:hypothetical protein SteCoe_9516 [Stentor coeruleus]|uniref:F-box domain-containing protein n=1 Tax=Stentor coeruleus TaxID=5963 RepID=A0A1R2CHQ7_9CILI|nr:hypothetical protein SteCoe_9516 [Stentor coeruleus]
MLSTNILSEVFEYLELHEIITISSVCRRYKIVSNKPSLYKREYIRLFMTDPEVSRKPSSEWRNLCIKALHLNFYQLSFKCPILNQSDIKIFFNELTSTLKSPDLVFPELRRDYLTFPTLIQDLLGNPYPLENNQYSQVTKQFNTKLNQIKSFFKSNPSDFLKKFLKPLSKIIKSKIINYCKAIELAIHESIFPIKDYMKYWEIYGFSIKRLYTILYPFMEYFNEEFYQDDICVDMFEHMNFMRSMIQIWIENVFMVRREQIFEEVDKVNRMIIEKEVDVMSIFGIKTFVESLLDLSLDEITVHFKDHSRLQVKCPYREVHEKVVNFFNIESILGKIDLDVLDILYQIWPCVTYKKIVENVINSCGNDIIDKNNFEASVNTGDFFINFRAKIVGFSPEDINKIGRCSNALIIDFNDDLRSFHNEKCK